MIYYINESEDKSILSKDYKKGKKDLSDFKLKIRQKDNGGKSLVLSWYDDLTKAAIVLVDTIPASDGYRWFGSLRVTSKYRGYGLADQIVDLLVTKYKAGALAVHKDNEIAIKLYKKHGFEISKTRLDKEYYYMYLKKNQVKSAIKESTNSQLIPLTENTDDNDDSILDEIKKFNKLLNSYKYGIPKNGKIGNTSAEDFYKNYRLESIQEFEKNKGGVCWDFVYYEDYYFKKNFKGVPTKLFYIIIDDNKNCPTHTFLTFSYKGKYYWFESSWSKYSGVHEYNSESELTKDVCKKHNMYNTGDYPMYMRSFKSSEVRPGMNTKEYMDVMNNGLKKVNI